MTMTSMLRCALAAVSIVVTACASPAAEPDESLTGTAHAALSSASATKSAYTLHARATYDAALGVTMIDVATTPLQQRPSDPDPHNSDEFIVAIVYLDPPAGPRRVLRVLTRADFAGSDQIGPGGGCIHFRLPAAVGDRLAIGGVVQLEGDPRARVAAAPLTTVVGGVWTPPSDL